MVENSKEGPNPNQTSYNSQPSRVNGFYYDHSRAASACPTPWQLPSFTEATDLLTWIRSNKNSKAASWWRTNEFNAFAGSANAGIFSNWSEGGYWWLRDTGPNQAPWALTFYSTSEDLDVWDANAWKSVRCIKN